MKLTLQHKKFKAQVSLPGSKSLSNRALMIKAYAGFKQMPIGRLSEADDTQMLIKNLDLIQNCAKTDIPTVVDCGNAGTVFRFLVTYLATTPGKWLLTGTDRMKLRPVADLVYSLRDLGAQIEYAENKDFPPLIIQGKKLEGGKTTVSMEKSSQFASSLVLAAPTWKNGLVLKLTDNLSSMPYLNMSLQLMRHYGANVLVKEREIHVLPVAYHKADLDIEPDWSGAAFWYEMVALSDGGELLLKNLSLNSLQGDKAMVGMFSMLGVESFQEPDGLLIFKTAKLSHNPEFNLQDYPDMLPSLVACCAGLRLEARFEGLENLRFKESDRTAALQEQVLQLGCQFEKLSEGSYRFRPASQLPSGKHITFQTYHDHRMAMAFAPLVLVLDSISIENPRVVVKSYPDFWQQFLSVQAAHGEI